MNIAIKTDKNKIRVKQTTRLNSSVRLSSIKNSVRLSKFISG